MSGLSKTADNLVKVSKVDVDSSFVSRLHAFFMALEYLVVCEFSVKDGPMTYIAELQKFRQKTPGLSFLIKLISCSGEKWLGSLATRGSTTRRSLRRSSMF